eukprot:CAMPEP_0180536132 /NCGR_PEP_ID=MMETSP1036_2-20121128/65109_1 /TAXON_ID=632150 /ORGANISM="Azadinium spinosum, Strain 3D9" /LENGTH=59 /DNA_ID=CAMNT_0022550619 /DNA_START=102 /DNA_END=281 /DNA_ORIENTATION=+
MAHTPALIATPPGARTIENDAATGSGVVAGDGDGDVAGDGDGAVAGDGDGDDAVESTPE